MFCTRWFVFTIVLLITPAVFIGIIAAVDWIDLSLTYATIGSILAGNAACAGRPPSSQGLGRINEVALSNPACALGRLMVQ